jgi:hypothetical protein
VRRHIAFPWIKSLNSHSWHSLPAQTNLGDSRHVTLASMPNRGARCASCGAWWTRWKLLEHGCRRCIDAQGCVRALAIISDRLNVAVRELICGFLILEPQRAIERRPGTTTHIRCRCTTCRGMHFTYGSRRRILWRWHLVVKKFIIICVRESSAAHHTTTPVLLGYRIHPRPNLRFQARSAFLHLHCSGNRFRPRLTEAWYAKMWPVSKVEWIDADIMDKLHQTYSKQIRLLATRGDAMFIALLCLPASEIKVLSSLIDDAIWNGKMAAYQSCPITFADLV